MLTRVLEYLNRRTGVLKTALFVFLVLVALTDIFVPRHEVHFFGDRIPVFWSAFGLGVCLAMSFACKWISKHVIARTEDYYDQ